MYLLWGSFELENMLVFFPWDELDTLLTSYRTLMKNFGHFVLEISAHKNSLDLAL